MTEQEKIKFLESNGWYQWYSKTHWVHQDVTKMFDQLDVYYYGSDHTNHQLTVDHAYSLQKRYDAL